MLAKKVELNIVKCCISQGQSFVILRSRSDDLIRRMMDDEDLDAASAREKLVESTAAGIKDELERSDAPAEALDELLQLLALVNKNDLRRLTVQDPAEWPPQGGTEIQERSLLEFFGKKARADK